MTTSLKLHRGTRRSICNQVGPRMGNSRFGFRSWYRSRIDQVPAGGFIDPRDCLLLEAISVSIRFFNAGTIILQLAQQEMVAVLEFRVLHDRS
jgi:hypothetical protein